MKKKIVIVGAGISGLTLAYLLKEQYDVTLLEKGSQTGGWMQTVQENGFLFELGPRSCRPKGNGRYTLHLIERLGLRDTLIVGDKDAKKRYIYRNQKLHCLPDSLLSFLKSPLMRPLALPLLKEPWIPSPNTKDESIYQFIKRRFGVFAAETLFDCITSGIYAGDTKKLSIKSCFPLLYAYEKKHGSVIRGALKKEPPHPITSPFIEKMQKEALFSFKGGMQTLTNALKNALKDQIHYESPLNSIDTNGPLTVHTPKKSYLCDHLYLAIPSTELAPHLPGTPKIERASIVTVNVGYRKDLLKEKGFGHLIPSKEKEETLGIVWDSSVFPEQNQNKEETRLTVMLGGAHHKDLIEKSESYLEGSALSAIKRQLGITSCPDALLVKKAKEAIPQYLVGHAEQVKKFEESLPPNITLLGNSFHGIAINDCIKNAYKEEQLIGNN